MSSEVFKARTGKKWMIPDSLTHNAGVITAILNGTPFTANLTGLVANTRYFIYFVPGVGLVYHTAPPSIGPGVSSYILIGAFYSNGGPPTLSSVAATAIAFGSFVNISGVPKTGWIADNMVIGASPTPPAKATIRVDDFNRWRLDGNCFFQWWTYHHNNASGTNNGNGNYTFPFPSGLTLNTSEWFPGAGDVNGRGSCGGAFSDVGGAYTKGSIKIFDTNRMLLVIDQESANNEVVISSSVGGMTSGTVSYGFWTTAIPANELSNTDLKDL